MGLAICGWVLTLPVRAGVPDWPYRDESSWLIARILQDLHGMLRYARAQPPVAKPLAELSIEQEEEGVWHVSFKIKAAAGRERKDLDIFHVWHVQGYAAYMKAELADKKAVKLKQSKLPGHLLDLRAELIARESQAVSKALARNMLAPQAHENAALLHGALILREASGRFYDVRHSLCRMTAHLALAYALRGRQALSTSGQLAEIILLSKGGRAKEAAARLARFGTGKSSKIRRAWRNALQLSITRNWRAAGPRKSLLERLAYARALVVSSQGQAAPGILAEAAKNKTDAELTDWHRMLLEDPPSRRCIIGEMAKVMQRESAELLAVWRHCFTGDLVREYAVLALNSAPGPCVGLNEDGRVQVQAVDWGAWAAFFQRHLCHVLMFTFSRQQTDRRYSALRLYPFVLLQQHRRAAGLCRQTMRRAVRLCREQPQTLNALNWLHLQALLEAADKSRSDPLLDRRRQLPPAGWPPATVDLLAELPTASTWFNDAIPAGTAYDASVRLRLAGTRQKDRLLEWRRLEPWNEFLAHRQLAGSAAATLAELEAVCGPLARYDLRLMRELAHRLRHRESEHLEVLERITKIDPNGFIPLAEYHLARQQFEMAARIFADAFKAGADPRLLADNCAWLVAYYQDKNEPQQALALAKRAAATRRYRGLRTIARLHERRGQLKDAEQYYLTLHRRYWDAGDLLAFYVRQGRLHGNRDYDQFSLALIKRLLLDPTVAEESRARAKERAATTIFPGGTTRVSAKRKYPPRRGLEIIKLAEAAKHLGLKPGAVIVGLNGIELQDIFQYFYTRCSITAPQATLIIWQDKQYIRREVNLAQWDAGVQVKNWRAPPPTAKERLKTRLETARTKQKPVIELNLSRLSLTGIPAEVLEFPELRVLNLGHNRLARLPAAISRLKNLESLILSDNRLHTLPPELGSLPKLKRLALDGNNLAGLPPALGRLTRLESLSLHDNLLTALPAGFARLLRLSSINLAGNRFEHLPAALLKLPALKRLILADNAIVSLPPGIGRNQLLTRLDLRGNRLDRLPPELGTLPGLQVLQLGGNRFREFPGAVLKLKKLRHLDLSRNRLTVIPPELKSLTQLKTILIRDNPLRRGREPEL